MENTVIIEGVVRETAVEQMLDDTPCLTFIIENKILRKVNSHTVEDITYIQITVPGELTVKFCLGHLKPGSIVHIRGNLANHGQGLCISADRVDIRETS